MAGCGWEESCDSAETITRDKVPRQAGVIRGIKDNVELSGFDQAEGRLLAMVVSSTLF